MVGCEKVDALGDVFGENRQFQHRALAIDVFELIFRDLVGRRALLAPLAFPNSRPPQYRVGINRVDADAVHRAFQRQAAGEMDLRRLGRAIGRRAGRRGEAVLRGDEDDGAANPLALHQPERLARDEEITGGENVHVLLPKLETGILDRRRRGDAGIRDDDVDAAEGARDLFERGDHRRLVSHVELDADRRIAAMALGDRHDTLVQRLLVDIADQPLCGRPANAAGAAGHIGDASGQRFRRGQALQLGLFQEPVFDIEGLLLRKADIGTDARGAAHDVDRVDIELAGDARRRLILGEGEHAYTRRKIHDRVRIAHRGRVRMLAALVIGGVVAPVAGEKIVETGNHLVETVALRIKGKNQRPDLGAQKVIRAGRAERRQRRQRVGIDEFQHFRRVGEMSDLALVG